MISNIHTRHSYSHNPDDRNRLLDVYVASRPVYEIVHGDKRGDNIGDYGRYGFRYQDTRHYSFQNHLEIFDGYVRCGYRYQTIPYPSHNTGEILR